MTETKYKYVCDKCNFYCNYESQWKIHINREIHKIGKRKKRSDYKEQKDTYICEKCNYTTINIYNYKRHILNEHSNKEKREKEFKYYCKYCDIGTFSKNSFDKHNETDRHNKNIMRQK